MKRPHTGKQTAGVGFPIRYVCAPTLLLMTHCSTQAEEQAKLAVVLWRLCNPGRSQANCQSPCKQQNGVFRWELSDCYSTFSCVFPKFPHCLCRTYSIQYVTKRNTVLIRGGKHAHGEICRDFFLANNIVDAC